MICDKCKKKTTSSWIPGSNYPRYEIKEETGIGDIAPIYLCYYCSQRLKRWLDEEPEQWGVKVYDDGSTEP